MPRLHSGQLRAVVALILLISIHATTALAASVTLPIVQVFQHKDTTMSCTAPAGTNTVHPFDHAVNPSPGCPHCGYYCAPASIAMISAFRGHAGAKVQQDQIYDHGKFSQGEIQGDGIIQTHGVGMFDAPAASGAGGDEVQQAFGWAVGPPVLYGVNYGAPPLTESIVIAKINAGTPILWCDHYGYPNELNPPLPPEWLEVNGHAKVIAGYDDQGTAAYGDDLYLIYDPWPTSGSPYWRPASAVLDSRDLYIVDAPLIESSGSSVGELKARFDAATDH